MDWSHIFSDELQVILLVSVLSDAILTLFLSFVFQNGHKFFDVIIVCCYLILLFVLTRFLNIRISHESFASFFYSTELFALETIFVLTIFFW